MKAFVAVLFIVFVTANASPAEDNMNEIPSVGPEYLDDLLQTKNYEEFSFLMDIQNPSLAEPQGNLSGDPMMQKDLEFGDYIISSKRAEEDRQGIRFDRYGGSRWPNGVVHYVISNSFSDQTKRTIEEAINTWNWNAHCVTFLPRNNEEAYVMFFPGRGCYSILGRTGKQQPISLQDPGCLRRGTILHEMEHAIGFMHEQNRYDRDNHIRILWENIPSGWQSQYRKTDPNVYGLQRTYDFSSIMHYGIQAPGTYKNAFEVLDKRVDQSQIGQRNNFSPIDLEKIRELYCTGGNS